MMPKAKSGYYNLLEDSRRDNPDLMHNLMLNVQTLGFPKGLMIELLRQGVILVGDLVTQQLQRTRMIAIHHKKIELILKSMSLILGMSVPFWQSRGATERGAATRRYALYRFRDKYYLDPNRNRLKAAKKITAEGRAARWLTTSRKKRAENHTGSIAPAAPIPIRDYLASRVASRQRPQV